jgi:hypothetical protein
MCPIIRSLYRRLNQCYTVLLTKFVAPKPVCWVAIWLVVGGVSLVFLSTKIPQTGDYRKTASRVLDELGVGLLTTAVLSAVFAWYFTIELARDVFKAALGVDLVPELKMAVSWILDTATVAVSTRVEVRIMRATEHPGMVDVTVSIERMMKNLGTKSQKVTSALGVDDYGMGVSILDCRLRTEDGEEFLGGDQTKRQKKIERSTPAHILQPGSKAEIQYQFCQRKPENSDLWWFFFEQTRSLTVIVCIEKGLCHTVNLLTHNERDREPKSSSEYSYVYECSTALLPGQGIKLRWWPNANGGQTEAAETVAGAAAADRTDLKPC